MKFLFPILVAGAAVCGAAQAQQSSSGANVERVEIQAATGPVIVRSVQPPLPNASDYDATVADLDKNGDGVVVRSEVPDGHALATEFHLVDRNRDGRITEAELQSWD